MDAADSVRFLIASAGVGQEKAAQGAVLWVAILIVLVIVFGVVLMAMRRHLFGPSGSTQDASEGMIQELRRLRDEGSISQEEFDRTIRTMKERMGALGSSPASGASAKPPQQRHNPARLDEGHRVAKPGFDLTGEPLPRRTGDDRVR